VTWDYDGERVISQGIANGSSSLRVPQVSGNALIGTDGTTRNPMFSTQNLLLKFGTTVHTNQLKRKPNVLTVEECVNVFGNHIYIGTRGDSRTRE
jgi:hypothetical protein